MTACRTSVRRASWDDGSTTTDGPGGAGHTVTPGLTPTMMEADVSLSRALDPWTAEVRMQARVAVQVAMARREAGDRVLRYYLSRAVAHGVRLEELTELTGMSRGELLSMTDPMVA